MNRLPTAYRRLISCPRKAGVELSVASATVESHKSQDNMTELIWEGKYKDDKKVTPVRIALPF